MKSQKPKSKFTQTNKPERNPRIKIVKESESNQESYAKFNFIQGKVMVSHIKVNENEILVKQTNRRITYISFSIKIIQNSHMKTE